MTCSYKYIQSPNFPAPKNWKKQNKSNKLIWYQTAAGKASSAFLPRFCGCFVGILSRHHCKTPMELRMAKTMKRQPEIGKFSTFFVEVLLGFLPVRPNKGPSKWTSLSKSFDDYIGGENFYPQTFPWENNKMIHATTALPIGSMYEISISVGIPYMNQSWAVIVLLMFFWRCLSQKLEKHQKIDGIIFACP